MSTTKIKQMREERGLTVSQIAAELDMSERQVFRLEGGETPLRRVHLLALAEVYGVSPAELEDAAA